MEVQEGSRRARRSHRSERSSAEHSTAPETTDSIDVYQSELVVRSWFEPYLDPANPAALPPRPSKRSLRKDERKLGVRMVSAICGIIVVEMLAFFVPGLVLASVFGSESCDEPVSTSLWLMCSTGAAAVACLSCTSIMVLCGTTGREGRSFECCGLGGLCLSFLFFLGNVCVRLVFLILGTVWAASSDCKSTSYGLWSSGVIYTSTSWVFLVAIVCVVPCCLCSICNLALRWECYVAVLNRQAERERTLGSAMDFPNTFGHLQEENIDPDLMSYEELLELGERIGVVNIGLSDEAIRHLPTIVYTPSQGSSQDAGIDITCMCCQCDYEAEDVMRRLPCGHRFHQDCVDEWLKQKPVCPKCRFFLTETAIVTGEAIIDTMPAYGAGGLPLPPMEYAGSPPHSDVPTLESESADQEEGVTTTEHNAVRAEIETQDVSNEVGGEEESVDTT